MNKHHAVTRRAQNYFILPSPVLVTIEPVYPPELLILISINFKKSQQVSLYIFLNLIWFLKMCPVYEPFMDLISVPASFNSCSFISDTVIKNSVIKLF